MKGLLGGGGGAGGSKGANGDKPPEGAGQDETEDLSEDQGSILLSMISQLRPGMDLSRITFPTFVLEPRSMLERITDFLSHPDLIFGAGGLEDPNERFIAVLRYYLAGWHIKPRGVKKPYNPILGEIFRCRYKYNDGSQGFYIAEQVSHHPPISAFYYCSPENKVEIFGELKPKSKFLGNSAANEMGGFNHIVLLDKPEDGEYDISMPNMYARGILFGKMVLELGDVAKVTNTNTNIHCDVEFKTKGFFSGTYNAIHGKIRSSKGELGEVTGKWSDQMYIQKGKHGDKELMFDAHKATAVPKTVPPESEQQENESRRLWSKVTDAIKRNDQDAATTEKSAIEDRQRELAKLREDAGERWTPKYFAIDGKKQEHRAKFKLPGASVEDQIRAAETWIFGSSSSSSAAAASDKDKDGKGDGESAGDREQGTQKPVAAVDSEAEKSTTTDASAAPPTSTTTGTGDTSEPATSTQTSTATTAGTAPPAGSSSSKSGRPPADSVSSSSVDSAATTGRPPTTTTATTTTSGSSASRSTSPSGTATSPTRSSGGDSHRHSNPISMAAAAVGLGKSSGSTSPDSNEHGLHGLLKRVHRKTVSNSPGSSAPDHEASSRHLP